MVDEFGEIGVDGSLLEGQHSNGDGVFIREVPGGCMCCAAGVPMQIALNQLLAKAKPDLLLIEPTGLGHPKEVLQILSEDYYQDLLSLHKTLTPPPHYHQEYPTRSLVSEAPIPECGFIRAVIDGEGTAALVGAFLPIRFLVAKGCFCI